jgi:UDP-N-acetylglucosamine:LPS N-acetylglucosamine transferase
LQRTRVRIKEGAFDDSKVVVVMGGACGASKVVGFKEGDGDKSQMFVATVI